MPRVLLLLTSAAWLVTSLAWARTEGEVRYTKAQAYSGALRYVRIDRGYEVTERDADSAYVMFKYVPLGQKSAAFGAIEVLDSGDSVKIFVSLPKMPSYHEIALRDGLIKRLREDYGEPKAREPKTPKKKQPRHDEAPERDDDAGDADSQPDRD